MRWSRTSRPPSSEPWLGADARRNVRVEFVTVVIDLDAPPASTPDAYLRLHLLSHLLVAPNTINLEGLFGHLPIVGWTTAGPVHPDCLRTDRARRCSAPASRCSGSTSSRGCSTTWCPTGCGSRTPRGCGSAPTSPPARPCMHEGFVNFNAGTLGASMVEGRITQGVVVGDGSDIGGGASIMGTLSGGGTERVSIGERSLLGANAGIGVSIGDDSVVEAGLYVTAGTKVSVIDPDAPDAEPRVVKAVELSGMPGLLFRRNSQTGAVEVLPRTGQGIHLNPALHA